MQKEKTEAKMNNYDFTFIVDADPHSDDFEDKFIDAGCDDATFLLVRGAAAISFDRDADSYKEAVLSAFDQILSTGSNVLRFEPDFLVSQKEIAERSGLTRSAIGLYCKGERLQGFPSPECKVTSPQPLWDWVTVSEWLVVQGKVAEDVHIEALVSRIINLGSQLNTFDPKCSIDIKKTLEEV